MRLLLPLADPAGAQRLGLLAILLLAAILKS
jgi:hypothetical protein